ncbi:MAG: hypothetical protein E6I91_02990 [Chloroflexi bacterium]|nr:MAG: hypothetical protein E6I91_02990 [Chloroflexota bacterium]
MKWYELADNPRAITELYTDVPLLQQVKWTRSLRHIKNAQPRAKWVSDHRAFPNRNIERLNKQTTSFRHIVRYDSDNIID